MASWVLEVWSVTTRGKLYPTGETIWLARDWGKTKQDLRTAMLWDGGPVGIAECFFPHPTGWKLSTDPPGANMERMSVRRLTAHYRILKERDSPAPLAWAARYPGIDKDGLFPQLSNALLTPRDFKSYHRLLCRRLVLRNTFPSECKLCRACGLWHERLSHLPKCPNLLALFGNFHALVSKCMQIGPLNEPLIMLGWMGSSYLPPALSALRIIIWKFIVITLTRIELQGERWNTKAIWAQALQRTHTRLLAHSEGARRWAVARWAKGDTVPEGVLARWNRQVYPLAIYDEAGRLTWKVSLTQPDSHAHA